MDEPTPEIEAVDEPESTGPKFEKFKVNKFSRKKSFKCLWMAFT